MSLWLSPADGHLWSNLDLPYKLLKEDHPRTSVTKLCFIWPSGFRGEHLLMCFRIRSNVKLCSPLAAILDWNRTCRTQFWNGITKGPLWQSFVLIGPVVSEEKILNEKFTTDGKSSPWLPWWAKKSRQGQICQIARMLKFIFPTQRSCGGNNVFDQPESPSVMFLWVILL
jgi:hypothetical protein